MQDAARLAAALGETSRLAIPDRIARAGGDRKRLGVSSEAGTAASVDASGAAACCRPRYAGVHWTPPRISHGCRAREATAGCAVRGGSANAAPAVTQRRPRTAPRHSAPARAYVLRPPRWDRGCPSPPGDAGARLAASRPEARAGLWAHGIRHACTPGAGSRRGSRASVAPAIHGRVSRLDRAPTASGRRARFELPRDCSGPPSK